MVVDKKEFMDNFIPFLDKKGIVFFSGAGVSTASGIKDFRGKNGLYMENINAEEILSYHFFKQNPLEFYKFFRGCLINDGVKPNLMHGVISTLEHDGIVSGIITQNIDGLDIAAGSCDVIELHGNANRFYCVKCRKKYDVNDVISMDLVPKCSCGGIIRPDIILYEEPLDDFLLMSAKEKIKYAKCLLVVGSSLRVNPAASLVHDFIVEKRFNKGKKLFIVNMGETDYDYFADYKYDGDIIDIASEIESELTTYQKNWIQIKRK